MQTVQLSVADEVKALGDAVAQEVADIKAKKGIAVYIGDFMPALLSLASNYQNLGNDIKQPDDIAYLVKCAAGIFLPAPAAAAPAAPAPAQP